MPVKLSKELVEEARESAKLFHRSLTGQIEHWATIGRVIEARLTGEDLAPLLKEQGSLRITHAAEPDQRAELMAILGQYLTGESTGGTYEWQEDLKDVPLYGIKEESGEMVRRNPDGTEEVVTAEDFK